MSEAFALADGCELCRALRLTPWYHEDEICWIAECEACGTPMVVWRWHGIAPPAEHVTHMPARLRAVTEVHFGDCYVDDKMRNIPDHYHAHGRPAGGFWGWESPPRPGP